MIFRTALLMYVIRSDYINLVVLLTFQLNNSTYDISELLYNACGKCVP